MQDRPITIYGDGKQVRDVLFVEDVVDAYLLAEAGMPGIRCEAFNIGGGPGNAVSLVELLDLIARLQGDKPQVTFDSWRPGDQAYYVSDTRKFEAATGWRPGTSVEAGVRQLHQWLKHRFGERLETRKTEGISA